MPIPRELRALTPPGARIEASRASWATPVRVTQDLYVSRDGGLFERSFAATA